MMSRFALSLLLLLGLPIAASFTIAQDHGGAKAEPDDVQQRPASDFPTLNFGRWSGKINVPDPVALSVDHRGDVFVTQTRRRKIQDLDIRENQDWIPSDVGLQSVDQKRSFLRQQLSIDNPNPTQQQRVDDWNQDGKHDWRDLTVVSEAIYRLRDKDGDAVADEITTFAEGFQTEVTGIAAGVLAYNGDVYSTIAPDVWKLRDDNDDGVADSRSILATGFGLHIAYAGHDMHGLTVGPDGKIYWSIGDKGINVTTPEGQHFFYPNQGGVLRCNPDGSDFEVFAHGLRNVQEFDFDAWGNFFGVDNDSDQNREKERFVAIVDAMDAGWRCHYQYRGDDYNPWTAERLWEMAGTDHPAYIVPPLRHYVDGPAGFKFNPGTALSPQHRDFFFMTNAPAGYQYAFRAKPRGDSFQMVDSHLFGSGAAIVGLAFGPDGALYGADWDGGYPLDEKGAVIRIDVDAAELPQEHLALRQQVQTLLRDGFANRDNTELSKLLSHADRRVRLGAQFALVEKDNTQALIAVLGNSETNTLGRLHCVWGLGQLARHGDLAASDALNGNLQDADPLVLAQVAKTVGETPKADVLSLVKLLKHDDLHVRVNAGLAIARHGDAVAVTPLLEQCDALKTDQHYLRHSLARALSVSATAEQLAQQATHDSTMRRMVCVLALRHQASPLVATFLRDSSPWVATEAARAIHDDQSIPAALRPLAAMLGKRQDVGESFQRRSINANLRLGTTESSQRLVDFLSDQNSPNAMRVAACRSIGDWNNPPVLDSVEGRYRDLTAKPREPITLDAQNALSQLVASADTPVRIAALVAARKQQLALDTDSLRTLLESDSVPAELRIEALNAVVQQSDTSVAPLLIRLTDSSNDAVSVRAIQWLTKDYSGEAFSTLRDLIHQSKSVRKQQAAIAGLAQLNTAESEQSLAKFGETVFSKNPRPELMLDIAAVVNHDRQPFAHLQPVIKQDQTDRAKKYNLGDAPSAAKFAFSLSGGNNENGKRVFETHLQAQCIRCHRIGKSGSNIGPELTKIAKQRDAEYLLRAIVHPSADIEPKYFTQAVLMDSGKIIRGVIKSENDDEVILILSDGKELAIPADEIEDVSSQKVSLMPDMTETLTPNEVRDLVTYLSRLK